MLRQGIFGAALTAIVLGWGGLVASRSPQGQPVDTARPAYGSEEDYGYGTRLSERERRGRDTWYFWTGGNEKFWARMAEITDGNVDLLNYVDSRRHGRRFVESRCHHRARPPAGARHAERDVARYPLLRAA